MRNTAFKNGQVVDFSPEYNAGFREGYKACADAHRKKRAKEKRRLVSFAKRGLLGLSLLLLTYVAIRLLDGDITVAIFTIPLSCLIFTGKGIF